MTTTTWKVTTGNWNLPGSWSDGVPGTADTAIINGGTIVLTNGTMQAAVTELTGSVTLNANGSLTAKGVSHIGNSTTTATFVVNVNTSGAVFQPEFVNTGTMLLTGPAGGGSTVEINPASNALPTFDNAAVLTVGTGSALFDDDNNVNPDSGVFLNSGTLSFLGDGATEVNTQGRFVDGVQNTGTIVLDGGGSLDPKFTFVDFLGTLSSTGTVSIRDATMHEAGGVSGGTIRFAGNQGVLAVDEPTPATTFAPILDNFGPTDIIRYTQTIDTLQYAAGTGVLTVNFTAGGSQQLTFTNLSATNFFINSSSPGQNDEVIIACFARGTRVLTDAGERPVQHLSVGDRVATLHGRRFARVRWIGHRTVEPAMRRKPADLWPVRITANAFGPAQPRRDLLLSPEHAVHVQGLLVPVHHLANGRSVRSEPVDAITYFHIELDRHEVLIADGLPCESYLDTGNRAAFVSETGAQASGTRSAV